MADITKLLRYVGGFNKEVDLNGGSDILKVSSVKIGSNSAEITTAIADKLIKIGDITDGASGADQVGATAVRTQVTVQSALEKLDTDLGTAESSLSGHIANTSNPHSVTKTQVGLGNVDNVQQLPMSYLDTDDTLAADSDVKVPSQQAVKAYADTKIPLSQKAAANGVAPLGADSKVPSAYLPSYVDDVLEYANFAALPVTGETGKIYVTLDTGETFRWSGTIYVEIATGDVASVNGKVGVVILHTDDLSDAGRTNKFATAAEKTKLGFISVTQAVDLDTMESDISTNATNISNHLSDASDAHDASAISFVNTTSGLTATDVQAAIDEVEGRVDTAETNITTNATNISNHLSDASDAHDASAISYVNTTSGLTATDAQTAIDEVEGRLQTAEGTLSSHVASTSNPHSVTKTQVGLGNVDNVQQLPMSYLDIDGTLAANSDSKVASQKAVKTYVDSKTTVQKIALSLTNNTGSAIPAGAVVCLSQSVAGEIVLADADALSTCEATVGVAIAEIANGASGSVQIAGEVTVAQAASFDLGKSVYVSQTAGQGTKTAPSANVIRLGQASATDKVILNIAIVLTV